MSDNGAKLFAPMAILLIFSLLAVRLACPNAFAGFSGVRIGFGLFDPPAVFLALEGSD